MKTIYLLTTLFLVSVSSTLSAQSETAAVEAACMNYIEGFYEGDTKKLINCLQPTLHKFGFWKDDKTGKYGEKGHYMTFEEAKDYARDVLEKKKFPGADAPKHVEVLDMMEHIACAKVTAWWGYDYMLLTKKGDKWMIEQVLWEGPLRN